MAKKKSKYQVEQVNKILDEIQDKIPQSIVKLVRIELGEESSQYSDFQIYNVKNRKTPNLKIAIAMKKAVENYYKDLK